jgi:autotransporter-associated beta strand protein
MFRPFSVYSLALNLGRFLYSDRPTLLGVVLLVGANTLSIAPASAAVYLYTPTDSTTDQWTVGTGWDALPVSGIGNTLIFGPVGLFGSSPLTNVSTNDFVSPFLLSGLTLGGTGSAVTGSPIAVTIAGGTLDFQDVSPGVSPVINLDASNGAGTSTVAYTVNSDVSLSNSLTVTGNGNASFTFGGAITGSNGLTKTGSSKIVLSGANTFSGGVAINAGTLGFDNSGATGTGTISLGGGVLQASSNDLVLSNTIIAQAGTSSGIDTNSHAITMNGAISASNAQIVKIGEGTLAFTAATNHVNSFFVNGGDVHQSTGASLTSYEIGIGSGSGNTGIYNIDGGALETLAGIPPLPAGGTASSFRIGDFGGTGTLNQTGGTVTVHGSLNVGNQGGHGTYNLSAGELHLISDQSTLGRTNGGSLGSGGSTGALNLSGTGLLSLENGAILTLSNWYGYTGGGTQGSGTLTQTGGTFAVANTSTLNLAGSGLGIYNLNGGTLQIGGTSLNGNYFGQSGPYQFNLGGGTIQVSGTKLTTSVKATLADSTISTIDTNGLGAALSGAISGSGKLTKIGAGTLTLSGANTFSGGVAINAGTLGFDNSGATGTGGISLGGGTLQASSSDLIIPNAITAQAGTSSSIDTNGHTITVNGAVSAPGAQVVKIGTGTLALTAATSHVNSFFVNGGDVHQSAGGSLTSYEIGIGSGSGNTGIYNIDGGALETLAGVPPLPAGGTASSFRIGDFGGTGTLNQTGGTVTVHGSLNVGNQGGHGTYNLSAGELHLASDQSTLGRTNGGSLSSGGSTGALNLSGAGLLSIENDAILTLSNWYGYTGSGAQGSGVLTQTGGTLAVANTARLNLTGHGSGTYHLDGGTLQIGGSSLVGVYFGEDGTYQFDLGGGTIQVNGSNLTTSVKATLVDSTISTIDTNGLGATLSGVLSGSGNLTKTGAGTLTLTAANTYTGVTTITGGTLQIGDGGNTGSLTGDIVNNGTLAFNRSDMVTHANVISGVGALNKGGTGTTILTAASSYSGPTTITGGKLVVDGSIANSSLTTIESGGTLGGHGTVGAVAIHSGGRISPGNSPGTLTTSAETWAGGGGYVWELNAASDDSGAKGTSYDWLNVNGGLDITSTTDGLFTIYVTSLTGTNAAGITPGFTYGVTYQWIVASATGGITGFNADHFAIDTSAFANDPNTIGFAISQSGNDIVLTYTAVPEPSAYAIGIAGLLGISIFLRRRNRIARQ